MLARRKIAIVCSLQTDGEKDRADEHMKAVKARRHVERRTIVRARKTEWRMQIFISLDAGEQNAEQHSCPQTFFQAVAVAMDQFMMRPGHGRA